MTASPSTQNGGGVSYSLDVQTLLIISSLAFLPGIVLLTTAFTRIIIVLSVLRQAFGLANSPPNMVLSALALALTIFIMQTPLQSINTHALQPYLAGSIGFHDFVANVELPLRTFMQHEVRRSALKLFVSLSGHHYADMNDVPFMTLVPAFATSELETAFQIGFLVYIPFVLIDLAVASILASLGMIMVSPTLISLPLKLLLFVTINGWSLVLGSLASSFVVTH